MHAQSNIHTDTYHASRESVAAAFGRRGRASGSSGRSERRGGGALLHLLVQHALACFRRRRRLGRRLCTGVSKRLYT